MTEEPHFATRFEIRTGNSRRLISFRIQSNVQSGSSPDEPDKPVGEFFDGPGFESPLYLVKPETAVALARDLLNAAHELK